MIYNLYLILRYTKNYSQSMCKHFILSNIRTAWRISWIEWQLPRDQNLKYVMNLIYGTNFMKQLSTCTWYRSFVITYTLGWMWGPITNVYQRRIVEFDKENPIVKDVQISWLLPKHELSFLLNPVNNISCKIR